MSDLSALPVTADLFRARAVLTQAKADRRLTVAETHELERIVRDGIELLLGHARKPNVLQLLGILESINVQPEMDGDRIEVRCEDVEALLNLGALITQHAPRESRFIIEGAHFEAKTGCVWWHAPAIEKEAA